MSSGKGILLKHIGRNGAGSEDNGGFLVRIRSRHELEGSASADRLHAVRHLRGLLGNSSGPTQRDDLVTIIEPRRMNNLLDEDLFT